ncbi:sigma-like sequence protein 1, mitochondrial [[Candida] jaroonii]|uniref:Sigma-like sequence protein 1, mitochondrial n=1 Tax=[Candida] jaroonii TaxID=467808 RepID=A0ACA9Y476_9ASCO|nr:sigma-like sequence protein 1, mitochondrial [[Candida] jaroonii]
MLRSFSTSVKRLNRQPGVSQLILDSLRDPSKIPKKQEVIVLNPFKYHSKKKTKVSKPTVNFTPDSFGLFEQTNDEESFLKLINNMKISETLLTERKVKLIKQKLASSFSKNQLNEYVNSYYNDPGFKGRRRGLKSKSKAQLSHIILKDLWNVRQSGVKSSAEDLLVTHDISLSKKDMFLLLSKDGMLLNYLSRVGCKIKLKKEKIQLTGTEDQITTTRIILNTILNNKFQEVLNLKIIKQLYVAKYGEFNLNRLSQLTQIHFEELDNDNFRLTSLNEHLIKRAKRSILWFLDFNPNIKNFHMIPSAYTDYDYLPIKIDESVSFKERANDLFRLSTSFQPSNDYIKQSFKDIDDTAEPEVDDLFKMENNFLTKNSITQSIDHPTEAILNDSEVDELFNTLKDFEQNSSIEQEKLLDPQITISFGNVLLETPKNPQSTNLIPVYDSHTNPTVKFNSSIPLINDKIMNLPLFDYDTLSFNDILDFKNNDPYRSVVQLVFQPSLYNTDNEDLVSYPPIEMWADINNFGKIEMDSFQLLTAEDENNFHISLPNKPSDLKVSSQLIGNLLKSEDALEVEDVKEQSIEDILKSTTVKYSNFKQQPYLEDFLINSTINFKGSEKTSIQPTIKIKFGDQLVEYQYISTHFRRVIEFNYKGKLLQYTIIEGGPLGGRRSEISLSGRDFTKETLKELVDDSVMLINQL